MSCNRHFLNLRWEHHVWRSRVTSAEHLATRETNMWGRVMNREAVRCHKEQVCEVCGKTRRSVSCLCDPAEAERCAIYRAWSDTHH